MRAKGREVVHEMIKVCRVSLGLLYGVAGERDLACSEQDMVLAASCTAFAWADADTRRVSNRVTRLYPSKRNWAAAEPLGCAARSGSTFDDDGASAFRRARFQRARLRVTQGRQVRCRYA